MLKRENKTNVLLFLFLLPIPSIAFLIFGESMIEFWDFARIPALLYVIKYLYDKFSSFTDKHNLGISIILLFSIIFFSFILTMVLENKDPLDSLVMVSNAFTSNGYAILGDSPGGKINSLILVWSGYVISGVATATLTAAIILRHFRRQFDDYKENVNQLQSSIGELQTSIEKLQDKLNNDE